MRPHTVYLACLSPKKDRKLQNVLKTHTEQIADLETIIRTEMANSFSVDFRLLDLKCKQFANGQILERDNTSREYAE